MATIKEITHDSSTTLSDFYGSITDIDGAITVTAAASLGSSVNGLSINYDAGTNFADAQDSFGPNTPSSARGRILVNLDGLTNASSSGLVISVEWIDAANTLLGIRISGDGTVGFEVEFLAFAGAGFSTIGPFALPSGEICIDMRSTRESSGGANDGELEGFVNGVSQGSLSNLDNFDDYAFENIGMFAWTTNASISGTCKIDEFLLTDDGSTALCIVSFSGYDLILGGGQP